MAIQTYAELATIYEGTMSTGVNRIIANGIANNAANLAEAFTLYIMIIAGLMCVREMPYKTFVAHLLRAGLIAMLMTVEGFNTYIATPAMDTVPVWITQTANNATGVTAGAQQFDLLSSAVTHQEAAALEQAVGLENIGYRIEIKAYNGLIKFFLTVGFWVYEFSRLMMGILVATVPFVLFLFLFEATRQIPLRLGHKAIGLFILQLMLSIMIQIMIAGDNTFMIHVQGADIANLGLDQQLNTIEDIAVFFGFGIGLVVFLPPVAAYIGGGIAMNVGAAMLSRMPGVASVVRATVSRSRK